MTGLSMEDRFKLPVWDQGENDVPVLRGALASLQGKIVEAKEVGSHSVMFMETTQIRVRADGDSLIYFDRDFHRIPRVEGAMSSMSCSKRCRPAQAPAAFALSLRTWLP
ncbi:flavin reductase (DIM6/NTAB) family NADH-FMN oxidoreductase RutF [Paraburkholderia youngii]